MDGLIRTPRRTAWRGAPLAPGLVVSLAALTGTLVDAEASPLVRPVRAAYFYHGMPVEHVDALAAHGFTRAVVHFAGDSIGADEATQLRAFDERGRAHGMEVVPHFPLEAPARLAARPADRRYTWGRGHVEPVACPMDSAWWVSALLDRAGEFLSTAPGTLRLAVDLEPRHGGRRHHDAGPCGCPHCLREYRPDARQDELSRTSLSGLQGFQEIRLAAILESVMAEFAARHPGVELGVFGLDLDSHVHRAFVRALGRSGIPVANYSEGSYSRGGAPLAGHRDRLRALGLESVSLVGGLWLQRLTPRDLGPAMTSILERADGFFVFSTYSLWCEPGQLAGPHLLRGSQEEYWSALRRINGRAHFGKPPVTIRAARGEP